MPAEATELDLPMDEQQSFLVSKEWLLNELLLDKSRITVLDCRSSNEYGESHIRHAINFSIPSIVLRRLAAGKIDLLSTIRCRDLKEKITNAYKDNIFVVYGSDINNSGSNYQRNSIVSNDTMHVLIRRLLKDGCQAVCLQDGFVEFRHAYPEWCESCNELLESPGSGNEMNDADIAVPLVGLRTLRISTTPSSIGGTGKEQQQQQQQQCSTQRSKTPALPSSSTEDSSSDSEHLDTAASVGFDDDKDFPIEIVPYLYLGNAANSEDLEALSRHGIQYILNVTPDLPNKFEKSRSMKYMQIPITDHWSQNLASFFPKAIQFIDEARSQNIGILVHCLAGVSRSVTITVAYLMARMSLNLNDAFSLVRSRKSNVGPNFHFMEQLHAFERELKTSSKWVALNMVPTNGNGNGSWTTSSSSSAKSATAAPLTTTEPSPPPSTNTRHSFVTSSSSASSSGQLSVESVDGTGTESGLSSASSSADCKCFRCGTPQTSVTCAKCPPASSSSSSSSSTNLSSANIISPTAIGRSPDSGIEFDRWTPGIGE